METSNAYQFLKKIGASTGRWPGSSNKLFGHPANAQIDSTDEYVGRLNSKLHW